MSLPLGYYALQDAFQQRGCAICVLIRQDVARVYRTLLYDLNIDPQTHERFRASRGFCNEHAWQFIDHGDALGIAAMTDVVIDEVLRTFQARPLPSARWRRAKRGEALAAALEPAQRCMACRVQEQSETSYLQILGAHLATLEDRYRASDGLCLPHFGRLLHKLPDDAAAEQAAALQKAAWEQLRGELQEFMRKSNYHNAHEAMGPEGDSWQRAIARMSGERGIFGRER